MPIIVVPSSVKIRAILLSPSIVFIALIGMLITSVKLDELFDRYQRWLRQPQHTEISCGMPCEPHRYTCGRARHRPSSCCDKIKLIDRAAKRSTARGRADVILTADMRGCQPCLRRTRGGTGTRHGGAGDFNFVYPRRTPGDAGAGPGGFLSF